LKTDELATGTTVSPISTDFDLGLPVILLQYYRVDIFPQKLDNHISLFIRRSKCKNAACMAWSAERPALRVVR